MVAQSALALVNTPFRLHGRDPVTGLDCVGLVLHALAAAGARPRLPDDYRVLVADPCTFRDWPERAGLVALADDAETDPGDIVAVRPGRLQLHLLVAVPGGHVHAHAALGRVVIMPGVLPWPVWGRWRCIPALL